MKKKDKCEQCGAMVKVSYFWRNNHILGKGLKNLCEDCFREQTSKNAAHLLNLYTKVVKNKCKKSSYKFFIKTYDKSTADEQVIFAGLVGEYCVSSL